MIELLHKKYKTPPPMHNNRNSVVTVCATRYCSYLQRNLQLRLQSLDLASQQVFTAASLCGLERK